MGGRVRDDMGAHVGDDAVDHNSSSTNGQPDGYHLVLAAGLVQILGQRPRSGVGVVRLQRGAAPRGVAIAVDEQGAVGVDDGDHDDVADEAAQDGAVDLCQEHDARRDLDCNAQPPRWLVSIANPRCSYVGVRRETGAWGNIRYSPILRSMHRLTEFVMTLCDHAAKYMLPTGRSGIIRPAIILDRLFVAMPLPYRE